MKRARGKGLKIIHLISEAVPFAKTGGLADVGGALPQALARLGADVKVILPLYRTIKHGDFKLEPTGLEVPVELDGRITGARIWKKQVEGVEYQFIDSDEWFDRKGLYGENGKDYGDNILRFGFFSRAALEAIAFQGISPEVIHCHDWQTGLVPVYLATIYRERKEFAGTAVIFTIHNLAYQGLADFSFLPRLHLPPGLDDPQMMEFYGRLNPMKGGIRFCDYITTVSRTYAREILTARFGCGLEGFLRQRANRIVGIKNGIDTETWSPERDIYIPYNYSADDISGKRECTLSLKEEAGLEAKKDVPLVAFIGRLVEQKGLDLILGALDAMVSKNIQFVFLGKGDPSIAEALEEARNKYPGIVSGTIGYEEPIAHRITAGADIFLMPSRFEPCGLNQQYALRYGAVPVVHRIGGLADTVIPATRKNLEAGKATGFAFRHYSVEDLLWAIDQSLHLWRDKETWLKIMKKGMSLDLSWDRPARSTS